MVWLCFPGMTSSLANLQTFFSTIFLFLTFLNIHIYFSILKTYDQQFTSTTKKSLHIIFKGCFRWPTRTKEVIKNWACLVGVYAFLIWNNLCDLVYQTPTKSYQSQIPVAFGITRSRDYQTPTRHALLGSGRPPKTAL